MKRFKVLLVLLLLLIPYVNVNADMVPIGSWSYANEATVGSTVTYVISGYLLEYGEGSNLNGKITYDTNQLQFLNIKLEDPTYIEGEAGLPEIKIMTNKNGTLEYKVVNELKESARVDVLVTFKVKSVPTTGRLMINFYPTDPDVLYGGEYAKLGINVLGNPTTEDDDTVVYPEDDNEPIDEDNNPIDDDNNDDNKEESKDQTSSDDEQEKAKEDSKDNCESNDIVLYSLIASGLVNVLLIGLLIINTMKNKKTKNKEN